MSKPVQIQTQVYRRSKRQSLPPIDTHGLTGEARMRQLGKRPSLPQVMMTSRAGQAGGENKWQQFSTPVYDWYTNPSYESADWLSLHDADQQAIVCNAKRVSCRPEDITWVRIAGDNIPGNMTGNVGPCSQNPVCHSHVNPGQSPVGSGMDSDQGSEQGSSRTRSRRRRRRSKQMESNMEQLASVRRSIPSDLDILPLSSMSLDDPVVQNALRVMNLGSTDGAGVTSPLLIKDLLHSSPLSSPMFDAQAQQQSAGEPVLLGRTRPRSRNRRRRSKQSDGSLERYAMRRGSSGTPEGPTTARTETGASHGTISQAQTIAARRRLSEPVARRRVNSVSDETFRKLKENLVKDWSMLDVDKLKDLSVEQLQELLLQQQVLLQHHRQQFQQRQQKQQDQLTQLRAKRNNSRTRRRRSQQRENTCNPEGNSTKTDGSPCRSTTPDVNANVSGPSKSSQLCIHMKSNRCDMCKDKSVLMNSIPVVQIPPKLDIGKPVANNNLHHKENKDSHPPRLGAGTDVCLLTSNIIKDSLEPETVQSLPLSNGNHPAPVTEECGSDAHADGSARKSVERILRPRTRRRRSKQHEHSLDRCATVRPVQSQNVTKNNVLGNNPDDKRNSVPTLLESSRTGHQGLPVHHRGSVPAIIISDPAQQQQFLWQLQHQHCSPPQQLPWVQLAKQNKNQSIGHQISSVQNDCMVNQPEQRVLRSRTRRRRSRHYEGVGDLSNCQLDAEMVNLHLNNSNSNANIHGSLNTIPFQDTVDTSGDTFSRQRSQTYSCPRMLHTREFYNPNVEPSTVIGFHRPKSEAYLHRTSKQDPYGHLQGTLTNVEKDFAKSPGQLNLVNSDVNDQPPASGDARLHSCDNANKGVEIPLVQPGLNSDYVDVTCPVSKESLDLSLPSEIHSSIGFTSKSLGQQHQSVPSTQVVQAPALEITDTEKVSVSQISPALTVNSAMTAAGSTLKATSQPFVPRSQNLIGGLQRHCSHGSLYPVPTTAGSLDVLKGRCGYGYVDPNQSVIVQPNFVADPFQMNHGQRPRSAIYVDSGTENFLNPFYRRRSLQYFDGTVDQFSMWRPLRRNSQPYIDSSRQEQYPNQDWNEYVNQGCDDVPVTSEQLICHFPSQQVPFHHNIACLQPDYISAQQDSGHLQRSKSVEWDASKPDKDCDARNTVIAPLSRSHSEEWDSAKKSGQPKLYRSTVFINSLSLQNDNVRNVNKHLDALKVYSSHETTSSAEGTEKKVPPSAPGQEGETESILRDFTEVQSYPPDTEKNLAVGITAIATVSKHENMIPQTAVEDSQCVVQSGQQIQSDDSLNNDVCENLKKRPDSICLQQLSNTSSLPSSLINSPEEQPDSLTCVVGKTMVDASTETGHVKRRRTRVRRRRRRSMQYVDENLNLELDQGDLAKMDDGDGFLVSAEDHQTSFPSWADLVEHNLDKVSSSSRENLLLGIDAQYEELKQNYGGNQPKKKNRKQKLKELNQKGEDKEGSDMDAFTVTVPETEAEVKTVELVNNVDATRDNKEVEEKLEEPLPTTATLLHNVDTAEIKVLDDKVAEKNEKNAEEKPEEIEKNEEVGMIEEENPVIKKDKAELKYKYREDQWSPLNPEGKKHYDRSFLLQLQFAPESQEKPDGLPKLPDVILDKPHLRNESSQSGPPRFGMPGMKSGGMMPDFTPGFIKASPGGKGPGMGGGRNRSQQKKGGPEPRKVISITLQHDVKLHTAQNAWKAGLKQPASQEDGNAKTEELYKRVRAILNKLAPQRFQTLIQQIMDLDIDSEERLKGTIDLVFEKAIDEPNFSVAYANMCKCMMPLKVPTEKPGEMVTFRALLLNRCQKEFEKDKVNEADLEKRQKEIDAAPEDQKKELKDARDMAERIAKRRSLGNIRFIGELFKLRMLTEGIMHDCLFKLLRSNDEDSLECLCRLLTTIGKDIDHEKAKPRINQYFMQMDKIIKQKRTSSRVRFMLQDVTDLRANNWVPRREDNNPKTIDQINKEAQHEAIQKAAMIQNVQVPSKRGSRGDRGPRGGPGGPQTSDDGWQAVTKTSRNILDPSRMKLTKQNVDENIQLGPGGRPGSFGSWGRGSSGGGKTSSQEAERPSTPANRFSALSERTDTYGGNSRMGGRGLTPGRDSSKGRNSGLGPQRGKNVARLSAEQDRDSALAAVRNIVSGGGGRSPMGSRNQSRDSSRNRDNPRDRDQRQVPAVKELGEDEIEKKTKAIMDEFLHLQDYKEAIICVKELESPKTIYFFVYTALNHVLERSPQARKITGTLLHDLIKQKVISVDIYLRGVKEVLEYADDMEIDVPMIWKYLGELMGPMVQDGSVPLGFLSAACEPLLRCNKAGVLVAEILHEAVHRLGHIKVAEQWKASSLQWASFLAPKEDVADFLKKHKLEFTIGPQEPRSPEAQTMSLAKIDASLHRLLVEKRVANEEVFDWIEANVGEARAKEPTFIRALMTAACFSAITGSGTNSMKVDPRQIQERLLLLQRYLDHQAELELQALYALQALVHKLEHPPGVLQTFFDTLYDEDIISEDAFNQWETSNDPAEQAGKGVARTSVTQFFTWLREAEEEGQEEN